jgi:hypothetical protein
LAKQAFRLSGSGHLVTIDNEAALNASCKLVGDVFDCYLNKDQTGTKQRPNKGKTGDLPLLSTFLILIKL